MGALSLILLPTLHCRVGNATSMDDKILEKLQSISHSPGHRPGFFDVEGVTRPLRAKALHNDVFSKKSVSSGETDSDYKNSHFCSIYTKMTQKKYIPLC